MLPCKCTHVYLWKCIYKSTFVFPFLYDEIFDNIPPVPRQCMWCQCLKYQANLGQLHSNQKMSVAHRSRNSCSAEQFSITHMYILNFWCIITHFQQKLPLFGCKKTDFDLSQRYQANVILYQLLLSNRRVQHIQCTISMQSLHCYKGSKAS